MTSENPRFSMRVTTRNKGSSREGSLIVFSDVWILSAIVLLFSIYMRFMLIHYVLTRMNLLLFVELLREPSRENRSDSAGNKRPVQQLDHCDVWR